MMLAIVWIPLHVSVCLLLVNTSHTPTNTHNDTELPNDTINSPVITSQCFVCGFCFMGSLLMPQSVLQAHCTITTLQNGDSFGRRISVCCFLLN